MAASFNFDRSKNMPLRSVRISSRAITPEDFRSRSFSFSKENGKYEDRSKHTGGSKVLLDQGLFDVARRLVNKMQAKMGQIDKVIEFYQILSGEGSEAEDGSPTQIRCHTHNSSIILYCQRDRKLLCGNCMFGTVEHKKHEVVQANKHLEKTIERDIKAFSKDLSRDKEEYDSLKNSWQNYLERLDISYTDSIIMLERKHDKEIALLSTKFLKMKEIIKDKYEQGKNIITNIIGSLSKIIKYFDYQRFIPSIKHIFTEYFCSFKEQLRNSLPNYKYGKYIETYFQRFADSIIKRHKTFLTQDK